MINYDVLTIEELQKIAKDCLKEIQMRRLVNTQLTEGK